MRRASFAIWLQPTRLMPKIKTNATKLNVNKQITFGDHVIAKGTNNTDVTGNAEALTHFTSKHAVLVSAVASAIAAKAASKQATTLLSAAKKDWTTSLNGLAGVTESLTGGDAAKIQGAGFDVKNAPTPTQELGQVMNLDVALNGKVGYSTITWNPLMGGDHYVIQTSLTPEDETSWAYVNTATGSSYYGNGATAGQKRWYRVAGVNAAGQGAWSDPALRPVM